MNHAVIDNVIELLSDVDQKLAESTHAHLEEGNLCPSCWASGALPEDQDTALLAALFNAAKESPDTARYMLIREAAEYQSQAILYRSLLEKLDDLFEPETTDEETNNNHAS